MQLIEWKFKILAWLAPGLIAEVDRLRWMTEARHDLHICPIPYNDLSLQTAFANAREYEPALIEGKATIQDRQASLVEALRRIN
jgi:hypothetical protein